MLLLRLCLDGLPRPPYSHLAALPSSFYGCGGCFVINSERFNISRLTARWLFQEERPRRRRSLGVSSGHLLTCVTVRTNKRTSAPALIGLYLASDDDWPLTRSLSVGTMSLPRSLGMVLIRVFDRYTQDLYINREGALSWWRCWGANDGLATFGGWLCSSYGYLAVWFPPARGRPPLSVTF